MPTGSCDHCPDPSYVAIDTASATHSLCTAHSASIVSAIDDLIADGMDSFSPQSAERCPNCLIPFSEDQSIIIRIGAWRRHALCRSCADPLLAAKPASILPASSS
jgi:hypothetical protein